MKTPVSRLFLVPIFAFTLTLSVPATAGFVPIPMTADSYNQDVIVEKTAPPPLVPVTTASMDTGTNNTGFAWHERGYNVDWPATGLPAPDSTVTIGGAMDHDFRFASSYKTNNALLIDSTLTNGTLTLAAPAACARLSFLVSGGNGAGTVACKVRHQDGSTETGTVICPDWLDALLAAYTTYGRIEVNAFTFADINANRPGLFIKDFELTNSTSPVTSVEFSFLGGVSHDAIFAVSGAATAGEPFTAFRVSGYNVDLVVEAGALHKGLLRGVTTATTEKGTANWASTWFEQGYFSPVPGCGLPAPASIVTNAMAPDHRYLLPSDYAANNATVLDADGPSAILTPVTPFKCAALSFLGTAGDGPATVGCQVHHADGNTETNWFMLPDWLSATTAAFVVTGRVNIDFRTVDLVRHPGLFARDITLTNTSSSVTSVVLTYAGGAVASHAVLFALSSSEVAPVVDSPVISIMPGPAGTFTVRSSGAGQLQSTSTLTGSQTVWRDEGPISSEVTIPAPNGEPARFYRVWVR